MASTCPLIRARRRSTPRTISLTDRVLISPGLDWLVSLPSEPLGSNSAAEKVMNQLKKLRLVVLVALFVTLIPINTGVAKKKKKEAPLRGTPVLWQQPNDISGRDLYLGPGGDEMRPDLRHIEFIKEEKGGYSKKYRVRDASRSEER